MKEIKLSQQGTKRLGFSALVSDEDYDHISKFKWLVYKHRTGRYYARRFDRLNRISIPMHRQIMGVTDPTRIIDHKDRNGLNNQRDNLRICNAAENARNRNKHKNGKSSLFKGVSFHKRVGKFVAQIYSKGIGKKHLGYFESEIEAAKAYNEKALLYYGAFANLNKFV